MKRRLIVLFILILPVVLWGQGDSAYKYEISLGTPMFPFLYNDIEPGYFTDITNPPATLQLHLMRTDFFIPMNFSYKISLNEKNKMRLGVEITKVPKSYRFDTFYWLGHIGVQHKLNKRKQKIETSLVFNLSGGYLEYSNYYYTNGLHNIGTVESASIILGGVGPGISMQYVFLEMFFIESETMIMISYGNGTGIVRNEKIGIEQLGIIFEKLFGINFGYKF